MADGLFRIAVAGVSPGCGFGLRRRRGTVGGHGLGGRVPEDVVDDIDSVAILGAGKVRNQFDDALGVSCACPCSGTCTVGLSSPLGGPSNIRARLHEVAEHSCWWQVAEWSAPRASPLADLDLRRPTILPRWPRDVAKCPPSPTLARPRQRGRRPEAAPALRSPPAPRPPKGAPEQLRNPYRMLPDSSPWFSGQTVRATRTPWPAAAGRSRVRGPPRTRPPPRP